MAIALPALHFDRFIWLERLSSIVWLGTTVALIRNDRKKSRFDFVTVVYIAIFCVLLFNNIRFFIQR